jgi:hypothetical protein
VNADRSDSAIPRHRPTSGRHIEPLVHESCIVRRTAETGSHPWDLFKEDAEKAIIAVFGLLAREPASFECTDS